MRGQSTARQPLSQLSISEWMRRQAPANATSLGRMRQGSAKSRAAHHHCRQPYWPRIKERLLARYLLLSMRRVSMLPTRQVLPLTRRHLSARLPLSELASVISAHRCLNGLDGYLFAFGFPQCPASSLSNPPDPGISPWRYGSPHNNSPVDCHGAQRRLLRCRSLPAMLDIWRRPSIL